MDNLKYLGLLEVLLIFSTIYFRSSQRDVDREALLRALDARRRPRHVEVQAGRGGGRRQARRQVGLQVGPNDRIGSDPEIGLWIDRYMYVKKAEK